jgi:hypothetical protein
MAAQKSTLIAENPFATRVTSALKSALKQSRFADAPHVDKSADLVS